LKINKIIITLIYDLARSKIRAALMYNSATSSCVQFVIECFLSATDRFAKSATKMVKSRCSSAIPSH